MQTINYHKEKIQCPYCKNVQEDQAFNEIKRCTKCGKKFHKIILKKVELCEKCGLIMYDIETDWMFRCNCDNNKCTGCDTEIKENNKKMFNNKRYCKRCHDEIVSLDINNLEQRCKNDK